MLGRQGIANVFVNLGIMVIIVRSLMNAFLDRTSCLARTEERQKEKPVGALVNVKRGISGITVRHL